MLLLAVELHNNGEHASNLLLVIVNMSVSMSMSIYNCEKTGSTPGFQSYTNPDIMEFRRFHFAVPWPVPNST
jgi:hypothetical protein